MSKEDKDRLDSISQRLLQMFTGYGPPPMAPGIMDIGRDAPKTFIAIRGNPEAFGEEVQPGFLTALGGGDVPEPPLHAQTTYRRKALAEWIASPDNPLFARVMVNRIWQFHFGSGLVKTSSDFGTRAGLPSNPELLDWLATEFVAKGWSMKAMHKLIMTSAAYQAGIHRECGRIGEGSRERSAVSLQPPPSGSGRDPRRIAAGLRRTESENGRLSGSPSADPGRNVRHDRQPRQQLECYA